MKRRYWILLGIIFVALFLRFYQLGNIPVGFHRDEAFLGYNAYSILKTGKDITGNFLPLHFKSFIYSPGGYAYFSLPFIALFGLSSFSVRFASAIFGTLTVLLTFILVRLVLKDEKLSFPLALTSAFTLALSPWHINLSRTSTESTVVVFFITLGVILYTYWVKNKRLWILPLSFMSFAVTLTIYQAPRAFLPLFIPLVIVFYGYKQKLKTFLPPLALYGILIVLPLIFILVNPTLALRIRTLNIFGTEETKLVLEEQIREDGVAGVTRPVTRIYHNKIIGYGKVFLTNYFSHFTYSYFFTDAGFPERYRVPGSGLMYLYELPLLALGIWYFLSKHRRLSLLILGWLLLAPVGSALTYDDIPNLQRTLLMFPPLAIVIGVGMVEGYLILKKSRLSLLITTGFVLVAVFLVGEYLHNYFVHQVHHHTWYRNEGYQELVGAINKRLPGYDKAVITTRHTAPTIFFLFFGTFNPATFQTETKSLTTHDFDRVNFDKYFFTTEECPLKESIEKTSLKDPEIFTNGKPTKTLVVNFFTCKEPGNFGEKIGEIYRPDGTKIFKIYSVVGSFENP